VWSSRGDVLIREGEVKLEKRRRSCRVIILASHRTTNPRIPYLLFYKLIIFFLFLKQINSIF
jgi:hypothetical protein